MFVVVFTFIGGLGPGSDFAWPGSDFACCLLLAIITVYLIMSSDHGPR